MDTDEDGLKDIDEMMYTKTSPYDKYSNGTIDSKKNSVSDADADLDGDGLSNVKEIEIGTDPLSDDTDYDGLTDNDELTKYKTEPTKYDTDEDGVSDGDEIALKLDPLKASTNGTTEDNEITTSQKIDAASDVLAKVNQDNPFNMSIDIDAAGIAANNTIVTLSRYYCAISDEFLIGEPIEVKYNDDLLIESAKISFNLDDDTAKNVKANDCMIFKYDTDSKCLLPVKTEYKDNTLYTESKELGTYCVFNVGEYIKELDKCSILQEKITDDIEVVFAIDVSSNISDSLNQTKDSIHSLCSTLFAVSKNASITILGYYDDSKIKIFCEDALRNIGKVDDALENLKAYSSSKNNRLDSGVSVIDSMISKNIFSKECENKYAFVIVDSDYSYKDRINNLDILLDEGNLRSPLRRSLVNIYDYDVQLNFVLSKANYDHNYTNILKKECEKYNFNVYSKGMFDSFAECAFEAIAKEYYSNKMIGCSGSLIPTKMPDKVNYRSFVECLPKSEDINKLPASDKDGNLDYKKVLAECGLDFNSLYSLCRKKQLTEEGLKQFLEKMADKFRLPVSAMPLIPYNGEDYTVKGNKDFIKVTGNYYAPPTFYEDIVPVSPEHEEGVNGRTVNGVWEDWR